MSQTKPIQELWESYRHNVEGSWTPDEAARDGFFKGAYGVLALSLKMVQLDPESARMLLNSMIQEFRGHGIEFEDLPDPKAKAMPRRPHLCHWPGCLTEVSPKMWGCPKHWFKLPGVLRGKIWGTYRPGQEIDKNPSAEYIAVAHEVQDWIRRHMVRDGDQ